MLQVNIPRSAIMKLDLAAAAAALLLALLPSSLMAAQQVSFDAYGGGSASTEIMFELPANPVPDFVAPDNSYFSLFGVTYMQGGFSPCPCQGDFTFYVKQGAKKGGVDSPAGYYAGPQLFDGPASSPTFLPGTYAIEFLNPASFYNHAEGSVSITSIQSPAPEPKSWVLLIAAFGAVGGVMRSRRRINHIAA
jgi:hypothetical protein